MAARPVQVANTRALAHKPPVIDDRGTVVYGRDPPFGREPRYQSQNVGRAVKDFFSHRSFEIGQRVRCPGYFTSCYDLSSFAEYTFDP